MSGRLSGKVAIITGCNSGIGRAIALRYAKEGAKIVCANRTEASRTSWEMGATTNELIKKNGGEAIFIKTSVADTQSVNSLVKQVVDMYGRIDILVNVAGCGTLGMLCVTDGLELMML
jgi:NAD(P)-dependent dehydrogenase (short-subunit alcohol dehydrogenase family)